MKEELKIPLMWKTATAVRETVVRVYRCTKVERRSTFSFGALVVVGNRAGRVGVDMARPTSPCCGGQGD